MVRINVALAFAALALAGCVPEIPPARVPPPANNATAVTVKEESAADPYVFVPTGKRDPFRSTAPRIGDGPDVPLLPLQQYELDALQLKFTSSSGPESFATVLDPTGEDHIVRVGDFLGKHWGKVARIAREAVDIEETISNEEGRVFTRIVSLQMAKPEAIASTGKYKLRRL